MRSVSEAARLRLVREALDHGPNAGDEHGCVCPVPLTCGWICVNILTQPQGSSEPRLRLVMSQGALNLGGHVPSCSRVGLQRLDKRVDVPWIRDSAVALSHAVEYHAQS